MLLGPHGALLGEADQTTQHNGYKLLHHSARGRCRKEQAAMPSFPTRSSAADSGAAEETCEGKKGEKKEKTLSLAVREGGEVEGDGGAERGGLRLAAEGGGGRGGRRHVPPLEIRSFASGSELLMEEGGSQP